MAIVVLVLWIATAAAGLTLLRAGGAGRRLSAEAAQMAMSAAAPAPVRVGAIPMTEDGRPPPAPRTRVVTAPGEHPLLEFAHPALAVAGVGCWTMFTFVHYRPMAWIAFGILVATITAGLAWLFRSRRATRRQARAAWVFPPRLIALHGLAAGCSIALTVLAALTASRG